MDARTKSIELPAGFLERVGGQLGRELDDFLTALAAPEEGLRVNTLRVEPGWFAGAAGFRLRPVPGVAEGFVLEAGEGAGKHPYHAAGLYYLQDPGAMVVGGVVDPRPGERVLDLSAAPGGKATHLAARLGGEGVLVANDPHRGRARELLGNIERLGVTNAIVTAETPDRLARHFGGWFDRVLVDAPCSGEAMFHKSEAARTDWSEAAVAGCARRQDDILAAAAELVAPGGLLVYSTCTFGPAENEEVVGRFLEAHPEFRLAPIPAVPGAEPLLPEPAGRVPAGVRLWPHRFPGAGHTIITLRRTEGDEPHGVRLAAHPPVSPSAAFASFASHVFPGWEPPPGRLRERSGGLYLAPPIEPELAGLHVLRSGVYLGTEQKHGFEPAHALAMAIGPAAAGSRIDLRVDDPRLAGYLRGEAIRGGGEAGWVVVTVDGFALGWGKRTGEVVKNHYPKGLRRHR